MTDNRPTPPKIPRPQPAPRVLSPRIGQLEADLAARPGFAAELLAQFWGEVVQAPLIEGGEHPEPIVTFVWRDGDSERVLLFVNRLSDERNLADSFMARVAGTDLWHLSYRMRADWRASYAFLPGGIDQSLGQAALRQSLDQAEADPLNPLRCPNRAGREMSVVELPDAPVQPYRFLAASGDDSLPLYRLPWGGGLTGEANFWLSLPRDYQTRAADGERFPLVVVLDGEVWQLGHNLAAMVEQMCADEGLPEPIVVLLDSGGVAQRWQLMGADGRVPAWLAEVLLPYLVANFAVVPDARAHLVLGQSLGGFVALKTALCFPGAFGAVSAQSASLWQEDLVPRINTELLAGSRVELVVGEQEWLLRDPSHDFVRALRDAGVRASLFEFNGGHDYACWRGTVLEAIARFLRY